MTEPEPSVVELGAGEAARWVAAGRTPPSAEAEDRSVSRFERLMATPGMRAATAVGTDGLLGGAMLRADPTQVTLWAPAFRAGLGADVRVAAARALASWAICVAETTGWKLVETKPADDTADLDVWLAALEHTGFVLLSCARLWEGPTSGWRHFDVDDHAAPSTVVVSDLDPSGMERLQDLIGAARRSSSDRSLAAEADGGQVLRSLRESTVARPVPELWFAFWRADWLLAYVIGSVGEDGTLWVMDVGVDPAARHCGLGLHAGATLLQRAESGGISSCRALIDVENSPSEALHRRLGLQPGADRFFTLHRTTALGRHRALPRDQSP